MHQRLYTHIRQGAVALRSGTSMQYWGGVTDQNHWHQPPPGHKLADLLKDANGRCGSWAQFMHETLDAVGVRTSKIYSLAPDTTVVPGAHGIVVKNWVFNPSTAPPAFTGNPIADYPWNWNPLNVTLPPGTPTGRYTPGGGISGQNHQDPFSTFTNHCVVIIGEESDEKVYDPSYEGTSTPYSGRLNWENQALDGYYQRVGGPWWDRARPDVYNTQETAWTHQSGDE